MLQTLALVDIPAAVVAPVVRIGADAHTNSDRRIRTAVWPGISAVCACRPGIAVLDTVLAVIVGGGVFYVLFQVSRGKWIGGGDVKLGWMLGLVAATPARSALLIFVAALLGSLASVPLLAAKRMKRTSVIPFGPFLMIAAIFVQLFGHAILMWYQKTFLSFTL